MKNLNKNYTSLLMIFLSTQAMAYSPVDPQISPGSLLICKPESSSTDCAMLSYDGDKLVIIKIKDYNKKTERTEDIKMELKGQATIINQAGQTVSLNSGGQSVFNSPVVMNNLNVNGTTTIGGDTYLNGKTQFKSQTNFIDFASFNQANFVNASFDNAQINNSLTTSVLHVKDKSFFAMPSATKNNQRGSYIDENGTFWHWVTLCDGKINDSSSGWFKLIVNNVDCSNAAGEFDWSKNVYWLHKKR